MGITIDDIRVLALSLPETTEEIHWGKPSFRVRGKIYAIIQEDPTKLVVKTTYDTRSANTILARDIYCVPDRGNVCWRHFFSVIVAIYSCNDQRQ